LTDYFLVIRRPPLFFPRAGWQVPFAVLNFRSPECTTVACVARTGIALPLPFLFPRDLFPLKPVPPSGWIAGAAVAYHQIMILRVFSPLMCFVYLKRATFRTRGADFLFLFGLRQIPDTTLRPIPIDTQPLLLWRKIFFFPSFSSLVDGPAIPHATNDATHSYGEDLFFFSVRNTPRSRSPPQK